MVLVLCRRLADCSALGAIQPGHELIESGPSSGSAQGYHGAIMLACVLMFVATQAI